MDKEKLVALINQGYTQQQLADAFKCSQTNIRYWLKKHQLSTQTYQKTSFGQDCICSDCGKLYQYNRQKGHTLKRCGSCWSTLSRRRVKEKAVAYLGGKCLRCSYNKCLRALSFHHRDAPNKEFTISQWAHLGWEKIEKELDKCDLLCANCHMEVHEILARSQAVKAVGR